MTLKFAAKFPHANFVHQSEFEVFVSRSVSIYLQLQTEATLAKSILCLFKENKHAFI